MMVCLDCAKRLRLKVNGMTGSWGKVLCDARKERQASLIVETPIDEEASGEALRKAVATGIDLPDIREPSTC